MRCYGFPEKDAWIYSTKEPAANGVGYTALEAIQDAYECLMAEIAEEQELEIRAALDELFTEVEETDNLIPGGFGGNGEFSDELEGTIKDVINMVKKGLTEHEQHKIADSIHDAIAEIVVGRYPEYGMEKAI